MYCQAKPQRADGKRLAAGGRGGRQPHRHRLPRHGVPVCWQPAWRSAAQAFGTGNPAGRRCSPDLCAAGALTAAQSLGRAGPRPREGPLQSTSNLCCQKGASHKEKGVYHGGQKGPMKRQALGETEEGHSSCPGLGGRGSLAAAHLGPTPHPAINPRSLPARQAFTLAGGVRGGSSPLELRPFSTPGIHDSVLTRLGVKTK